jgi:hypothetical protein
LFSEMPREDGEGDAAVKEILPKSGLVYSER